MDDPSVVPLSYRKSVTIGELLDLVKANVDDTIDPMKVEIHISTPNVEVLSVLDDPADYREAIDYVGGLQDITLLDMEYYPPQSDEPEHHGVVWVWATDDAGAEIIRR